ncbi:MAG: bacteriocin family protein [Methanoregulaceae archaeon]|nr:bacteriocin family protein [Methanoregulaceae archaeon]
MDSVYLSRDDAPVSPALWDLLDRTMADAAKSVLAGRRLVHIEGPFGLGLKAVPLADCVVDGGLITSQAMPVSLVQTSFVVSKRDLAAYEQDGVYFPSEPVMCAAINAATREDEIIFNGTTGVNGLLNAEGVAGQNLGSWNTVGKAADEIIQSITRLDEAGFHGPYCLALSPARYNLLLRRYPQGGTEIEHMRTIATDGVFKAPVLGSGGVILASGREYASIVIGQDMSIGFIGPVRETLEFSISESLALIIRQPESICALTDK